MADYSPEDASRAESILNRLLNAEADPERQEVRVELPPQPDNLVLSDVQWSVSQFLDDIRILSYFQSDMPALEFAGGMIPVSVVYAANQSGYYQIPLQMGRTQMGPYIYEFYRAMVQEIHSNLSFLGFKWINREEAQSIFRRRCIDFVATRIAGLNRLSGNPGFLHLPQFLGGPPVPTPGCNFTVTTNSKGLRVFWSGAHYVSPSYFGHPTSPTSSVLQSATYIFGVDGGAYGNNIQWDRNAVISLPGNITQVHLNY
jgi:hypothetical protein